jgi:dTDP-4-dehydrorhamnose reductase
MELWGGIECTLNRVDDQWHDQLELSGHRHRPEDLELIAQLGIRTLRYPVLWEAVAPSNAHEFRWQWADARLARLRDLGMTPVVGLVHHGSGPGYTSLVRDSFAPGLADFAARVAARFPWLEFFTPVNEPLTTARFSGLYGMWFPHGRDDRCFARALINQCRAIVLAMQAIRRAIPTAKLVQTEDLGTTYSTPHLEYQRDFDNERRWLTWDLLCGRVTRSHALYGFLIGCGISAEELGWFLDHPCPPDVIGINHYVTSDRYLDECHGRYGARSVGGNWKERYADVEAVRVLKGGYQGFRVLQTAWNRYGLPVALTEVHLGCSREEQLRWYIDAWRAANEAAEAGCDVRAVTAWALFGAFNWDTLLTRDGAYEPGAFDVRAPRPRPTAIARLIATLGRRAVAEPAALGAGWWQRPDKLLCGGEGAPMLSLGRERPLGSAPPLLICGSAGSLGRAMMQCCDERNLAYRAVDRSQLDICDLPAVSRLLAEVQPWALINTAGFVRVDEAEHRREQCFRDNAAGAAVLMQAARQLDIPFLTFSSDLVFDGTSQDPLVESSSTRPLNQYGRSKEAAERLVLEYGKTLCVRTAAFFGSVHGDFVHDALRSFAAGRRFRAATDVIVSPTYLPDLVGACLDFLIDRESGIFHLVNQGALSWADWARLAARTFEVDCHALEPRHAMELGWTALRPRFSALTSERSMLMPSLEDAMHRHAHRFRARFMKAMRRA